MKKQLLGAVAVVAVMAGAHSAYAGVDEAKKMD